jgi:glycosyltransferase involved in cell wall biosynthesis
VKHEPKSERISVLVPFYNRKETISFALDSMLSQTHQDFEVVIVDDGSSDGTAEVVAPYLHRDDRFRLLRHGSNRGAAAAWNTALSAARGEWITFLDSDDQLLPQSLEDRLAVARHEGVQVVNSDCLVWETGAAEAKRWGIEPVTGRVYHQLLRGPAATQYFLMSRQAMERFGRFDPLIVAYHDWDLGIRLAKNFEFGWLDEPTFVWDRRGEDGVSNDARRVARGYEQVFRKHSAAVFTKLGPQALAAHYCIASGLYARAGASDDARRCARRGEMLNRLVWPRPRRVVRRVAGTLWLRARRVGNSGPTGRE